MVRKLIYIDKSAYHARELRNSLIEWNEVCKELKPLLERRKEKGLPPIKLVCIAGIDYIYKGKVES